MVRRCVNEVIKSARNDAVHQKGIAVLETSAVMMVTLSMLLAAWGAIDIYQRGLTLAELIKSSFYDGVVKTYKINEQTNSIEIDQRGITKYLEDKALDIRRVIEADQIRSDSFRIQGAVIEVMWPEGGQPKIGSVNLIVAQGSLSLNQDLAQSLDFARSASHFVEQLKHSPAGRQKVLVPDIWHGTSGRPSYLCDSFALAGLAAAVKIEKGLGRMLLEGIGKDPVIVRYSFNVLRGQL